jgi:hypothetical protein
MKFAFLFALRTYRYAIWEALLFQVFKAGVVGWELAIEITDRVP